jgi:hypothetical protein
MLAITVERTWRAKGVDVTEKRDVNPNDTEKILNKGWMGNYFSTRDN